MCVCRIDLMYVLCVGLNEMCLCVCDEHELVDVSLEEWIALGMNMIFDIMCFLCIIACIIDACEMFSCRFRIKEP